MLKYNAILFDVDGTLIDSAPGILHTLEEVFHTMGVDTTNVNLRRYLGAAASQELAAFLPTRRRSKRLSGGTGQATTTKAAMSVLFSRVCRRCSAA